MRSLPSFIAILLIWPSFFAVYGRGEDLVLKNDRPNATLLELYSSEGCSSCPPAEAWVSGLKDSPKLWTEVFPVVFHVDYWDGLSWPNRFAKAAYTQRQRSYAASLGQYSVYTPEFVVGGREWRAWFDGGRQLHSDSPTSGTLCLQVKGNGSQVIGSFLPDSHSSVPAIYNLNVALLGMNILSDVRGGENGGRQLRHDFVVLDFATSRLGTDANARSATVSLKPSTGDQPEALVAWVSTPDGKILQVAGGALPTSASTTMSATQR